MSKTSYQRYAATPVHYPAGGGALLVWSFSVYSLFIVGVVVAWAVLTDQNQHPWRIPSAAGLVLASVVWAWRWVQRTLLPAHIAWDAQAWSLTSALSASVPLEGVPQVCVDGQHWLVVRAMPFGQPVRWLWLERKASPAHWRALRRALYSRPKPNVAITDASQHSGASAPLP